MAGYVIADVDVTDPGKFAEYRDAVEPTVEKYGGSYIVRGGANEAVEGVWAPNRLVVIKFESLERAKEWYYSDAYRGPMGLRHESAVSNVVLVEGV